jgi:hypothetical protein
VPGLAEVFAAFLRDIAQNTVCYSARCLIQELQWLRVLSAVLPAQVITHDSGQSNAQEPFVCTRPRSPVFDRGWQYHLADESVWMCTWFGSGRGDSSLMLKETPFKFLTTMGHATSEKKRSSQLFSGFFTFLIFVRDPTATNKPH